MANLNSNNYNYIIIYNLKSENNKNEVRADKRTNKKLI